MSYYAPPADCEGQNMLDVNMAVWQHAMRQRPAAITGDATPRRYTVCRPVDQWYSVAGRGFPLGAVMGHDDERLFAGRPGDLGATVEELEYGIPAGTIKTIQRCWARRDRPLPDRWETK